MGVCVLETGDGGLVAVPKVQWFSNPGCSLEGGYGGDTTTFEVHAMRFVTNTCYSSSWIVLAGPEVQTSSGFVDELCFSRYRALHMAIGGDLDAETMPWATYILDSPGCCN